MSDRHNQRDADDADHEHDEKDSDRQALEEFALLAGAPRFHPGLHELWAAFGSAPQRRSRL